MIGYSNVYCNFPLSKSANNSEIWNLSEHYVVRVFVVVIVCLVLFLNNLVAPCTEKYTLCLFGFPLKIKVRDFFSIIGHLEKSRIFSYFHRSQMQRVITHIKLIQNTHIKSDLFFFFSAKSMFGGKVTKTCIIFQPEKFLSFLETLKPV